MTHFNEVSENLIGSPKKVQPVKIPFGVQFAINYFFGVHGILGLIIQPTFLRRRELFKNLNSIFDKLRIICLLYGIIN